MNELLLILVPLVAAVLAALWPHDRTRPWFLPAAGLAHALLAFGLLLRPPEAPFHPWLGYDPLARAMLPAVSLLYLGCAFYGVPYLRLRAERPNRVFVVSFLAALGLMSAAHMARHLGVLWIATEAVTLCSVPLLHFNNTPRAFEATWKYLLVGGTGIALSLLGSFCLGYASLHGGGTGDLTFVALMAQGAGLSRPWVLIAWVLLLVGYGTKMGLAPMHTWKPDAYGEAPGIVGAMLAGGVTTVAFTAVLRVRAVVDAAGAGVVASRTLLVIGLFSTLVAALFLLSARDFKRMLAYSSLEHVGLICVGIGLGTPVTIFGALLHMGYHALTKPVLFFAAGNIHQTFHTLEFRLIGHGVLKTLPVTVLCLGLAAVAATGLPPFGLFFSELTVISGGIAAGQTTVSVLVLGALIACFCGMLLQFTRILPGEPKGGRHHDGRAWDGVPAMGLLLGGLLLFSVWLPRPLLAVMQQAAGIIGGKS